MRYDNRPGGLDGPPRPSLAETLGRIAGIALAGTALAFVILALAWVTAWMIVNFPGS